MDGPGRMTDDALSPSLNAEHRRLLIPSSPPLSAPIVSAYVTGRSCEYRRENTASDNTGCYSLRLNGTNKIKCSDLATMSV